jgi:hypothetical protein
VSVRAFSNKLNWEENLEINAFNILVFFCDEKIVKDIVMLDAWKSVNPMLWRRISEM